MDLDSIAPAVLSRCLLDGVLMPTAKITKRTVDSIVATAADQFIWDTDVPGFGLKVTPRGSKSYVVQYRMGGRETHAQRRAIGRHGVWTPDEARTEARRVLQMVDRGIDPREDDRKRKRETVTLAFDTYADLFIEQYLKKNWKRWEEGKARIDQHCKPQLGNRPITSFERADITPILDSVADRPALVSHVFSVLRKLFNWAVSRGDLKVSPMNGMKVEGVKSRSRTLTDEEIAAVWIAAGRLGELYGPIVRLLLLNGQRLEENSAMEWREVDLPKALWTLPERRAKNGLIHLVPLGPSSMEIIKSQKLTSPTYVFSSNNKNAVNGWSKARPRLAAMTLKVLRERAAERGEDPAKVEIERWTPHDLRRTVATGLPSLGVPAEVVEAVLNHISGSKAGVAGIYNRYQYLPEKTAALLKWDEHLRALVAAPNVHPERVEEVA